MKYEILWNHRCGCFEYAFFQREMMNRWETASSSLRKREECNFTTSIRRLENPAPKKSDHGMPQPVAPTKKLERFGSNDTKTQLLNLVVFRHVERHDLNGGRDNTIDWWSPSLNGYIISMDWFRGFFYRKTPYLTVKTMVSCNFSLKPIHWSSGWGYTYDGVRELGLLWIIIPSWMGKIKFMFQTTSQSWYITISTDNNMVISMMISLLIIVMSCHITIPPPLLQSNGYKFYPHVSWSYQWIHGFFQEKTHQIVPSFLV